MAKRTNKTSSPSMITVDGKPIEVNVDGYTLGRRLTVPLISLTHERKLAFRVEGEITQGAETTKNEKMDKPMSTVAIVKLDDGELVQLVCPTVLESALRRVPGGYVGKNFLAVQGAKAQGKRYFTIELFELEAA